MVNKAIRFAVNAHEGQCRKGTERPYILHPIEVASIVARMTDDQEVICAAVLHDTVEDCNNITPKLLREMFSPRVAELVA